MPFWTIQGVLLFIILILFNINLAAGTVALLLASLFAYLLDPVFHSIAYFLLTGIPALQNFWEWLHNTPIGPLSRFNNTVVLGSFIGGLILLIPIYWGMTKLLLLTVPGWKSELKSGKSFKQ